VSCTQQKQSKSEEKIVQLASGAFMINDFLRNPHFSSSTKKGKLKNHIKPVHEAKKPFKCNICDTSFTQKGDLNKHVASVHEGRKLNYDFCDKEFFR
jgi:uncharacterized Zn-finger protein